MKSVAIQDLATWAAANAEFEDDGILQEAMLQLIEEGKVASTTREGRVYYYLRGANS